MLHISLVKGCHHWRWRGANFRHMLGTMPYAQGWMFIVYLLYQRIHVYKLSSNKPSVYLYSNQYNLFTVPIQICRTFEGPWRSGGGFSRAGGGVPMIPLNPSGRIHTVCNNENVERCTMQYYSQMWEIRVRLTLQRFTWNKK